MEDHPRRTVPGDLRDRIHASIRRDGPMTFAGFMEAALYDPADGFYAGRPVGERGHFVTSPHVSGGFGVLVARQIEELWSALGAPGSFTVVEVGAGDGMLASQVMEALPADLRGALRYVAVERGAAAREALTQLPVAAMAELDAVLGPLVGCVLANELLDNLPFHRLLRTEDGWREVYVSLDGDRLVTLEGPVSTPILTDLAPPAVPVGSEVPVSPAAIRFLDRSGSLLERGYVVVFDYALDAKRPSPVHGYRHHGVVAEVLSDPGSRDITAAVDLDALARHARRRGWTAWGPQTQRRVLLALGLRDLEERARESQGRALREGRGLDAVRIRSQRSRLRQLVDPSGLGGLEVLCVGVGVSTPPSWAHHGESVK